MEPPHVSRAAQREQTDRSLTVEREACDLTSFEDLIAIDEIADAVISRARARADEVLAAARARADTHPVSQKSLLESLRVDRQRLLEDAALTEERATADDVLRKEQEARRAPRHIARAQTDEDLLAERADTDTTFERRDAYLGVVGHELRNMIAAVDGFASLLESAAGHGGQQVLHTQNIHRAAARMKRLVGDLVDLASIDAGTLKMLREKLDPEQILHEAVDSYQALAGAKNIRLRAEIVMPLGRAELDPSRMLQVLVNLLSNAIKFTPPGGSVTLHVERMHDELHFSVQDTGLGIPKHELQDVFARFHQVAKNDLRGLGLGLYISRCIVHAHGGRIWAESVLGEGSTFRFTLPCGSPPSC